MNYFLKLHSIALIFVSLKWRPRTFWHKTYEPQMMLLSNCIENLKYWDISCPGRHHDLVDNFVFSVSQTIMEMSGVVTNHPVFFSSIVPSNEYITVFNITIVRCKVGYSLVQNTSYYFNAYFVFRICLFS